MTKSNIIYLHGFNSAFKPLQEKSIILGEIGQVFGLDYNSLSTRDTIISDIVSYASTVENPVFCGTSLGGYYAIEVGRILDKPSIGINPAIDPYQYLSFCPPEHTLFNFVTCKSGKLEKDAANSYKEYSLVNDSEGYKYPPLILLDLGDTLINAMDTQRYFDDSKFTVKMFAGGSHKFDHIVESKQYIVDYINLFAKQR